MDQFCTRLRKMPCAKGAVFVFIIEANLDRIRAKLIAQHTRAYGAATVMCEDPKNHDQPGVWTTSTVKTQMNNDANFFITLKSLHVLPVEHKNNSFASNGDLSTSKTTLKLFQDQMKSYRRKIDKVSTDPSKDVKARYTGKSAGSKDDLVMAFEIALHWGIVFMAEERYVRPYNIEPHVVLNRIRPEFNELYS